MECFKAVEIDTAGDIAGIPFARMKSGIEFGIDKGFDLLADDIVNFQFYIAGFRQAEFDIGYRIKRIRVITD